ncbi:cell wall metabolism sensor histidine kinase WalK [Asticcacaulis sp. AND118]|uniref:sensor histidine kinase n=1 Tax=Asticcacaulis sp. AND118 TaxID=2840468 RepID=UPI001CFFF418|nr:HAMP domain-containing sensor histidine kinase [Asticcacaulis sp. AND118]UDF03170.1 HAMP domain-containing histidine kinase [Asticcacaulis sp. AND118]
MFALPNLSRLSLKSNVFRQTPFRLTLMFITVYSFVAVLIFAYIYIASSAETKAVSDAQVKSRIDYLEEVYREQGEAAVLETLSEEDITEWFFVKIAYLDDGRILAQNRRATTEVSPPVFGHIRDKAKIAGGDGRPFQINYRLTDPAGKRKSYAYRGQVLTLKPGLYLYVGMDTSWSEKGFDMGFKALWGGGVLVIVLGLFAGMIINNEVSRSVQGLMQVFDQVKEGDLKARARLRNSGDEFDALAERVNETLDRMEKTMGNLKYAGDAIAHDLRTPLSRLRSKLEVSLYDVEKDPSQAPEVIERALAETDQLLRTFQTVFSISRLQAAGQAPDQKLFDASALAEDMCELFEALAEDKGLEFTAEIESGVNAYGNRDFLAQAMANLLDNAIKYTQTGGITLRLRHNSRREIEFSVTDTGQGVPEADRARITQRFVRLENSRSLPGVGLGLSMVEAVAVAHKGRLSIDEGPGVYEDQGPGLRTALVLPAVAG